MEEEIFPFFGDDLSKIESVDMPLYKEVAWDYDYNIPLVRNGNFVAATENEAIKTWCQKALTVPRYRHIIYSWAYGEELESLIGSQYTPILSRAECVRYMEECLLVNPYITGISDVDASFSDGKLSVTCKINTVYGTTGIEVNL